MTSHSKSLLYAAIIGLLIVAIFLGFLFGFNNPVSWILIGVLLMTPVIYNRTHKTNTIPWKDEYSVGIESLDNDHKKLISLLNQFTTAYDYAMSEVYERQALDDLIDYTKYHFAREEKLMESFDYPDFDAHKKQHQAMIGEVEVFVEKYNRQGHQALDEISSFLKDWLINHINGTDKHYGKHLKNNGVN